MLRFAVADLFRVVESVYAAALDASAWDHALQGMARAVGGTAAGLHVERAGVAVTQRWVGLDARPHLLENAFYNEWARPHDGDDFMAAAIERSAHGQTFVRVVGEASRRFDSRDAQVLALFVPHVRRALQMAERLQTFPLDVPPSLESELRGSYGLTAAEARVAACVGGGLAPKEAAAKLGTSWNTVRFQLRQVYAKTRTSGQSELARLVQRQELGIR